MIPMLLATTVLLSFAQAQPVERRCDAIPETSAEQRITKKICEGLDARDAYRLSLNIEMAARSALLAGIPDDYERRQTLATWGQADEALDGARTEMAASFRDAIAEITKLYGISPRFDGKQVNDGPAVGSDLPWAPRYIFRLNSEAPVLREIDIPTRGSKPARKAYLKWSQSKERLEQAWALTWPDSRIDILDEAFEDALSRNSPRVLGFVLAHEAFHFDQLRSRRWKTVNEREAEAYKEDIRNAARFGLTTSEIGLLRERLGYNQGKVLRQRLHFENPPSDLPSPAAEEKYRDEWERLRAAFQATPAQREALRQQIELERNGRNAPTPQEPESLDTLWAALDHISKLVCGIGSVTTDDLRNEFIAAVAAMPTNLALLDYDREVVTVACPRYLANQALLLRRDLGAAPDEEWLNAAITEGRLRQTEPRGRTRRIPVPNVGPAPAPLAPMPAQPPDPAPDPDVPDIGTGGPLPSPPDYNHCIDTRCIPR